MARQSDLFIVSRRKPGGWYGFPTLWIEKALGITRSTVRRIVEEA